MAARFFLALCLCGIVSAPRVLSSLPEEETKHNVLLLTIDTLRADRLSCYGSRMPQTPNIDSLVERGVLFSRAFANTSTTLPSHANILTGMTPNHHGVHENLNFVVHQALETLAEFLKTNGYSTGAFVGAYPLDARFGMSQGFDVYDDNYSRVHTISLSSLERNAESVIGPALEWLKGQMPPWFLWVHCWDPHTPYDPPEPFKTQYSDRPYEGEVAYVDQSLGKLFDYLRENDLFDSTLVVFTGDHGESLGEHGEETHGYFAYNSSIWIPLIFSFPGLSQGRVDDPVSHVDIFPTICEALGIKAPAALQGRSLLPAMKGKRLPERPIYIESLYPYYSRGWAPIKGFIQKGKKFIDSPIPEVYDLGNDFDELRNLDGTEETDRLKSLLEKIIRALTPDENIEAARQADRETRQKLASLGYVSGSGVSPAAKREFGVEDDVKVMVSYINRVNEGRNLAKNGQMEKGIGLLEDILEERKDIDLAYKYLASIYQESGKTEEAVAILERGLEALPSSYEIYIDYMKALLSAAQYDRVISSFERLNLREAEYDPEIWNNLGTAYARKGQLETAIKAFEMGLSLDDRHPELYNNLAGASYTYSLKTKDPFVFSRCFEYYKKAIELDPEYAAPYYGLGHAYREEGNLGGAIYCWQKALELAPGFREAHFDLAIAYLNAGDKSRSLRLLNEYKKHYSDLLSPAEKEKLNALIEQCKR